MRPREDREANCMLRAARMPVLLEGPVLDATCRPQRPTRLNIEAMVCCLGALQHRSSRASGVGSVPEISPHGDQICTQYMYGVSMRHPEPEPG
jgi:hypothetical protein